MQAGGARACADQAFEGSFRPSAFIAVGGPNTMVGGSLLGSLEFNRNNPWKPGGRGPAGSDGGEEQKKRKNPRATGEESTLMENKVVSIVRKTPTPGRMPSVRVRGPHLLLFLWARPASLWCSRQVEQEGKAVCKVSRPHGEGP